MDLLDTLVPLDHQGQLVQLEIQDILGNKDKWVQMVLEVFLETQGLLDRLDQLDTMVHMEVQAVLVPQVQ